MATATTTPYVPVEQYLNTMYHPDVDYVDGQLEERNLGEFDHADLQSALSAILRLRAEEWKIRVTTEVRVQVTTENYRVPDVCVTDASLPRERIIHHPPLLCLEVLSPEDTFRRQRVRVQDFLNMGVPQVWIFDTEKKWATVCTPAGDSRHETGVLSLPGTPIFIDLQEAFSTLSR